MHPTEPVTGQIYVSAAEDLAIAIGAITATSTGPIIEASIIELKPPKSGGGMDIMRRPAKLNREEWEAMSKEHGLALKPSA